MKKIILTIILAIYSSSAFAGSCPMLWGEVDGKIAKAQELRDAGKKAHDNGDHSKSEKLLKQALELFEG